MTKAIRRPLSYAPLSFWRKYYSQLRAAGKLHGTIKQALDTLQRRQKWQESPLRRSQQSDIPLGKQSAQEVGQTARHQHPRVRRWSAATSRIAKGGVWVREEDRGAYSHSCTWRKVDHVPTIRSCGACTRGHLVAFYGLERFRFRAPRGYHFGHDSLGLYIVADRHEAKKHYRYHFDSDEIRSGLVSVLRTAAIAHAEEQRAAERKARAQKRRERIQERLRARALEVGVYVTFRDSRASGNCGPGTAVWCRQRGLDFRASYPLEVIERLAKGSYQAERACNAAIARSAEDLQRGYCLLPERE